MSEAADGDASWCNVAEEAGGGRAASGAPEVLEVFQLF